MNSSKEMEAEHVDEIGCILHSRLGKHIRAKISNINKHNHPALIFVRANLNCYAALLWVFKQAQRIRVFNAKSNIHSAEDSYLHWTER